MNKMLSIYKKGSLHAYEEDEEELDPLPYPMKDYFD